MYVIFSIHIDDPARAEGIFIRVFVSFSRFFCAILEVAF